MPRRAEARAAILATLLAIAACAPAPRDLAVGVHRVRLVPPPGWEVLAQGRQSFVRWGETSISLTDAGPASARGLARELRAARTIWLAGRRQDAFARIRTLGGPPLRFATADQRAEFWRAWNDVAYRAEAADSASIGRAFDDLLAGSRGLPPVAPASLEEFVLERWSDAGRREIHQRSSPSLHGRAWTRLTTWSRVSHLDPRPVAVLDDDGYLLVVGVEHGDPAVAGPAFERMMSTIEVAQDTTATR